MSTPSDPNFDPNSFHPRGEGLGWRLRLTRRRIVLLASFGLISMGIFLWPVVMQRLLPPHTVTAASTQTVPAGSNSYLPTPSYASPEVTIEENARNTLTPSPTITPEILPTIPPSHTDQGVIVLAIQEGVYTRLYAYEPQTLPFTRLSSGLWDDITPAISPDGMQVAFASNRNGYWNLYLLDLSNGEVTQLTDSPEYVGAPSWSPDGKWLAFERYGGEEDGGLDIFIRSLENDEVIRLTDHTATDHSPTWSSRGREIAFVSDRTGEPEIWLADLDRSGEDRFRNLSQNNQAWEAYPAWSPDGRYLAWASNEDGYRHLYIWEAGLAEEPHYQPRYAGSGDIPTWSPDGATLLSALFMPNQSYLVAYPAETPGLVMPAMKLPGEVSGLSWGRQTLPFPLAGSIEAAAQTTPPPLYTPALVPPTDVPNDRRIVVALADVQAPHPFLHDLVDESFQALRWDLAYKAGWDFLYTLENAYLPLTSPQELGMQEDWLYTGRAFAFTTSALDAGWLAVSREDHGPETYWRVFVRARFQDGSAGVPMHRAPWEFTARYSGNMADYERGGALAKSVPPGYWLDFTRLASGYGWERLPALSHWGASYSAARFNQFIYSNGLDWQTAMLELYPPEVLITPTAIIPPTRTPTPTPYWYRTPTPTLTSSPRPTMTPQSLNAIATPDAASAFPTQSTSPITTGP